MSLLKFHHLVVLVIITWVFSSNPVHAFEAGAGLAAVEQGDDRLRPAAAIHLGFTPEYQSRLHYWGRKLGPVTERSVLLSFMRRGALFGSKYLQAGFGGALLDEMIDIGYEDKNLGSHDANEHNFNLGVAFDLAYHFKSGLMFFELSWDGHVFPAGQGGLLLATGRIQTISMTMGVAL